MLSFHFHSEKANKRCALICVGGLSCLSALYSPRSFQNMLLFPVPWLVQPPRPPPILITSHDPIDRSLLLRFFFFFPVWPLLSYKLLFLINQTSLLLSCYIHVHLNLQLRAKRLGGCLICGFMYLRYKNFKKQKKASFLSFFLVSPSQLSFVHDGLLSNQLTCIYVL